MSIEKYSDYIALHEQKSKTAGLRSIEEAPSQEDSDITKKVNKFSGQGHNFFVSKNGSQHVYMHDWSDNDTAIYNVHDTDTGKTHQVQVEHGGDSVSAKQVRAAAPKEVSDSTVKMIHKDINDSQEY